MKRLIPGLLAAMLAVPLANSAPTFNKDIAPIVFKNCASCHRPGEVAPFALLDYGDVKKRAKQIVKVTESRFMPPWKAKAGFGEFLNEHHLADKDIALIKQWVEAGTPEGKPADLPPVPKFPEGWASGEPELVLTPPEDYLVEAEGRDVYRCFVIPTSFPEDRYVNLVELRPDNRKVVHHILLYVDTSGKARELDEKDPGPGYSTFGGTGFRNSGHIGGWAPGNFPHPLPKGIGVVIPKGADLVMQVHYHKSGKEEKDRSRIGLHFAKGPVDKRVRTIPVTKVPLRIPAGDSNFVVTASLPVMFDATVYQVMPHMHLLGKEMRVTATLPDGTVKPLVHVPDWDFNWQTTYIFKEPMRLPRGSTVQLEARFDNTEGNPNNPHKPPRLVTFGEQTTDEMCMAFLTYTIDAEALTKGISISGSRQMRRRQPAPAAAEGGAK